MENYLPIRIAEPPLGLVAWALWKNPPPWRAAEVESTAEQEEETI